MEIQDILRSLRRRWMIAGGFLAAGVAAAGASIVLAVPEYDATTRLYVTVASAESGSATDLVQGGNAAQQRVRSYVDIVPTPRVLQSAIDTLGLKTTADDLAHSVRASSPNESVLLNITVRDESPRRAADIANAVAASFTELVTDELEAPKADAPSPVSVRIVQPALEPTERATPQASRSLLLGIGGGLALGILAALLRDLLDTKVRGRASVESTTDRPLLGVIPKNREIARAPVYVQGDTRSQFAESFRELRTSLRFVDTEHEQHAFVITSAQASEGKTTTVLNLAAALMEGGSRVVVVDCDLRRPAVGPRVDVDNGAGLTDVLIGRAELEDVLHPWGTNGSVLPAGPTPPNPADLLASEGMRELLKVLSEDYDHVLIDTPPLLPVTDAAILGAATSGALIVTAAGRSRTNELREAERILDRAGARTLGVVVGMVQPKHNRYGYGYSSSPDLSPADLSANRGSRVAT